MNDTNSTFNAHYDKTYFTSLLVAEGLVLIPTVLGNVFLIYCIKRYKSLHKRNYYLIANLAVSDLLVGLLFIPYDMAAVWYPEIRRKKITCLLRSAFLHCLLGASDLNLLVISLERYTAIRFPLWHLRLSNSSVCLPIATAWAITILISVLPFLGWNSWNDQLKCKYKWYAPLSDSYKNFCVVVFVGAVVVSFVLFVSIFFIVSKNLKKRCEMRDEFWRNKMSVKGLKSSLEKTKLFTLVLGVFALCWGPYCIISAIKPLFPSLENILFVAQNYASLFALLNSGLNWIIFGLKNRKIRAAFKETLCICKIDKEDTTKQTNSTLSNSPWQEESTINGISYKTAYI